MLYNIFRHISQGSTQMSLHPKKHSLIHFWILLASLFSDSHYYLMVYLSAYILATLLEGRNLVTQYHVYSTMYTGLHSLNISLMHKYFNGKYNSDKLRMSLKTDNSCVICIPDSACL